MKEFNCHILYVTFNSERLIQNDFNKNDLNKKEILYVYWKRKGIGILKRII